MRFRDIEYSVVQGIKRGLWKWSTSIEGTVVSGKEPSKAAAVVTVEKTIDRALDSKTALPVQPPALDDRVRSRSDPEHSRLICGTSHSNIASPEAQSGV
jgi:hypothetical protein